MAVVILGPVLAGSIQAAVPNQSTTSVWNASYNTNLPTGAAIWTTNVTIGSVTIQSRKSKTKRKLKSVLKSGFEMSSCFLHRLVHLVGFWNWSEIKGFTNSMSACKLHKSNCVKLYAISSLYLTSLGKVMEKVPVLQDGVLAPDHIVSFSLFRTPFPGGGEPPGIHSMM